MTKAPGERIIALDTIRGVAVMGILLLNIVGFSMPWAAYMNPRAFGGWHGGDLGVWAVNFVLFDGKMRGLFSFLFGASMLLIIERAERKGESPALVHYTRMVWLLVFGLLHLWLVWDGDILAHYALVGLIAYAFRSRPPARLVVAGLVLLLIQFLIGSIVPATVAALQALPDPDAATRTALAQLNEAFGMPPQEAIAAELAGMRGSYWHTLTYRLDQNLWFPVKFLWQGGAETLAYMLFGMAAYRTGMLTGDWDRARYRRWLVRCWALGLPAYVLLAAYLIAAQFSLFSVTLGVWLLPTLVRPLMILGWICLLQLLINPDGSLTRRFAATGRMAFTNYLVTSLICTAVFDGFGFGMYGVLTRAELYAFVPLVWALLLLWSKPWLDRYRYGPFEWLWRSVARWELQPMRGGPRAAP